MARFKVAVLEVDGVELDVPTELILSAANVGYDPSDGEFDPSIDTVKAALDNISNLDLETLTEFESFTSPNQQTTTSSGFQTKSGYPYTTSTKPAGRYIVDHTVQCGNTDKEKRAGHRVQWRPGTSGSWQTLVDIRDANSVDNQFQLRTGFNEIELTADGVFQVRIQYGQNRDGGVTRIREANIKIGKVANA